MTGPGAVVIGQGPAGLLTASILSQAGFSVTVVADGEGSLPLWSATFDFVNFDAGGRPVADPFEVPDLWPGSWPQDAWRVGWSWLGRLLGRIGVSYRPAARNRWAITLGGQLKPVYLAPDWLYATERPGPVWMVGLAGLPDAASPATAERYRASSGSLARYDRLDPPPPWRPFWSAVHWAGYLETDAGRGWLTETLRRTAGEVDPAWPLVMPAVLGIDRVETVVAGLVEALKRPVGEVLWVPPALAGIRLRDRWRRWLRTRGVVFTRGHVTAVAESRVHTADGRRLEAEAVVLATGGLLGGGLVLDGEGRLLDSARGTEVAWGGAVEELGAVGVGLRVSGVLGVAGRQVGGDLDRFGCGGGLALYSAVEASRLIADDRVARILHEGGGVGEPGGRLS